MNDEQLLAVTEAAFLDEFDKIKESGVGSFLTGGIKTLGRLGGKGGSKISLRGLARHGRMTYRKAGGGWEGVKALAKSPAGQAAGVSGLGGLTGYGAYKATIGRDRGQQRY